MQTHKVVCKTMCNLICSIIHSLVLQPPAQSISQPHSDQLLLLAVLLWTSGPFCTGSVPVSALPHRPGAAGRRLAPTGDASEAPGTVLSSSCPSGLPTPSGWDRETERSLQ